MNGLGVDPEDGVVGLGALPTIDLDPATLESAAQAALTAARTVHTATQHTEAAWKPLSGTLQAPGAVDALYGKITPVVHEAAALLKATSAYADALQQLAATARSLQRHADETALGMHGLRIDVDTALHDDPLTALEGGKAATAAIFSKNPELAQRNAQLAGAAAGIASAWKKAQQEAADAITAIHGGNGDGLPKGAGALSTVAPLAAVTTFNKSLTFLGDYASLVRAAQHGPNGVKQWASRHPNLYKQLQEHPPAPDVVRSWWGSLNQAERNALALGASVLVGNLEGVAYRDRNIANQSALKSRIQELEAERAPYEARYKELKAQEEAVAGGSRVAPRGLSMQLAQYYAEYIRPYDLLLAPLYSINRAVHPGAKQGERRMLVSMTTDDQPLASVAVGDLDTAKHVTYAVPGMGSSTKDMDGWTTAARNIYYAQQNNLPDHRNAVVAWVGYVSPDPTTVLDLDKAKAGAPRLLHSLDGLHGTNPEASDVNVVAHSYGSTMSALALSKQDEHVRTLVTVGSAGVSLPYASDIKVGHVFAGQANEGDKIDLANPAKPLHSGDVWASIGRDFSKDHAFNPALPAFGGTRFDVATSPDGRGVTDHDTNIGTVGFGAGYLDQNTTSLANVARATTGQSVTHYRPETSTPLNDANQNGETDWEKYLRFKDDLFRSQ